MKNLVNHGYIIKYFLKNSIISINKKIVEIREKLNEIETRGIIQKTNKTKS